MDEECSVNVLLLDHDTPEDFQNCLCQTYEGFSMAYFIFKRVLQYYFVAMSVYFSVLILENHHAKYWIYFDFWTLFLMAMTPGISVFYFSVRQNEYQSEWDFMPWPFKSYWIAFNVGLPASILSCIVFWSIVYTSESSVFNIILNTATPFLIICEFLLAAFPLRLLHFPFFFIFYLIYILFTVIYYELDATGENGEVYIYEVLDWTDPGKAVLYAFLGLLMGETIFLVFWFLSAGKLWMRNNYVY